ncbi:MAG: SIR2 family protein [Geobacteraceae bacterium]
MTTGKGKVQPQQVDIPKKTKTEALAELTDDTSPTHCPYRQAMLLQQSLSSDKMRVAFLLGAGCPVSIRVPDGEGSKPLIPDIQGLTSHVYSALEASEEYKKSIGVVVQRLKDSGKAQPNIEDILSHIRSLHEVAGNSIIDGLSKSDLGKLDETVCKITTEIVKAKLPKDITPYHQLATWIGGIKRTYPVEVFTPNYDLLMEQAFEERRVPYFDGFVGSRHTFFDLVSMENDVLPSRWARLWKVHGSINWWRTPKGDVERRNEIVPGDRQMIYPSHLKYDQSRRMPYFAMIDRLRAFLTQGQAVLVTCGYSFADQHLNDVILQGLNGNPNAVCFGLLFGDRSSAAEAVLRASKNPNLSLLAADGAVLGTVERRWRSDEKTEHPLHCLAVNSGEMKNRTDAPDSQCKFLLGDFKTLGDFLAQQLSMSDNDGGGKHGA